MTEVGGTEKIKYDAQNVLWVVLWAALVLAISASACERKIALLASTTYIPNLPSKIIEIGGQPLVCNMSIIPVFYDAATFDVVVANLTAPGEYIGVLSMLDHAGSGRLHTIVSAAGIPCMFYEQLTQQGSPEGLLTSFWVHPTPRTYARAIGDFCRMNGWTKLGVIGIDTLGIYGPLLAKRALSGAEIANYVVISTERLIKEYMKAAKQVGVIGKYHTWIQLEENTWDIAAIMQDTGFSSEDLRGFFSISADYAPSVFQSGKYQTAVLDDAAHIIALAANISVNLTNQELFQRILTTTYTGETGTIDFVNAQRNGGLRVFNWNVENYRWDPVAYLGSGDLVQTHPMIFATGTTTPTTTDLQHLIKIGATPSLTLPSTLQQPVRSMFLQWIGAVRYAIKVINENSTLLSNYTLLLVEEDAKFEVSAALEGVNNLLSHHKMSVFLASPFNWLAQALYPTLAARRIPQVSFGASSTDFSDTTLYPYFFRTILSDDAQGEAMAAIAHHHRWTHIIALTDPTTYGSMGLAAFIRASRGKIEVSHSWTVSSDVDTLNYIISRIKSSGIRIIVLFVSSDWMQPLLSQARDSGIVGPGWVWFGSESFSSFTLGEGQDQYRGSIAISVANVLPPQRLDFLEQLTRLDPNYFPGCGPNVSLHSITALAYDTIWYIAQALDTIRMNNSDSLKDTEIVAEALNKTIWPGGLTGAVGSEYSNASLAQRYSIMNWRLGDGWVEVGWIPLDKDAQPHLTTSIIWPDGTTDTPHDLEKDIVVSEYYLETTSIGAICILVIALVAAVGVIATLVVVIVFRNYAPIKNSSPVFLCIVLAGYLLALGSIAAWVGRPTEASCQARAWAGTLAFLISYGAILVKTWRLWKLYYRPSRPNMPPLPDLLLLKILGVALVVHILVLTFWQLLDPIQISIVDSPSGTGVNVLCEGNDTQTWMGCVFAYLGSLLLVGAILSWRTRKLPQRYNEALYIAIGTYNTLWVGVVVIPTVTALTQEAPALAAIIAASGILVTTIGSWLSLFVPKLHVLRTRPRGTKHQLRRNQEINTSVSPSIEFENGGEPEIRVPSTNLKLPVQSIVSDGLTTSALDYEPEFSSQLTSSRYPSVTLPSPKPTSTRSRKQNKQHHQVPITLSHPSADSSPLTSVKSELESSNVSHISVTPPATSRTVSAKENRTRAPKELVVMVSDTAASPPQPTSTAPISMGFKYKSAPSDSSTTSSEDEGDAISKISIRPSRSSGMVAPATVRLSYNGTVESDTDESAALELDPMTQNRRPINVYNASSSEDDDDDAKSNSNSRNKDDGDNDQS